MKRFKVVFTFQDNEKKRGEAEIEANTSSEAIKKVTDWLAGIGAKGVTVVTANEMK